MFPEEVVFTVYVTAVNERNGSVAALGSPGCWTCAWLRGPRSTLLGPVLSDLLLFLRLRPAGPVCLRAPRRAPLRSGVALWPALIGRSGRVPSWLAALAARGCGTFSEGEAGALLSLGGAGVRERRGRETKRKGRGYTTAGRDRDAESNLTASPEASSGQGSPKKACPPRS